MTTKKTVALSLVLLALIGAASLILLGGSPGEAVATTEPPSAQLAPQLAPRLAPQPLSPQDGWVFVESDLVLRWDWPPGLAENQAFAVKVWYENKPPVETWTQETRFEAQESIDSYSRDLGTFYWQVAVVKVSPERGFEGVDSAWSPVQSLHRVRRFIPTPYPVDQQSDTAKWITSLHLSSHTEIIDYMNGFIAVNSTSGDPPEPYKPNRSDAVAMMLAYSQGRGEKPSMWCNDRSTAMLTLLQELGAESRLIFLYGGNASSIAEHTMLEVFNPDTQRWELYNPGDLHFIDRDTQKRVSIERLVFGPLDNILGCNSKGECDAEQVTRFEKLFQAFRYGYSDTFWVNPDRFDVSKRFPDNDNKNLAEYLTGDPRDFVFRFDSWLDD